MLLRYMNVAIVDAGTRRRKAIMKGVGVHACEQGKGWKGRNSKQIDNVNRLDGEDFWYRQDVPAREGLEIKSLVGMVLHPVAAIVRSVVRVVRGRMEGSTERIDAAVAASDVPIAVALNRRDALIMWRIVLQHIAVDG